MGYPKSPTVHLLPGILLAVLLSVARSGAQTTEGCVWPDLETPHWDRVAREFFSLALPPGLLAEDIDNEDSLRSQWGSDWIEIHTDYGDVGTVFGHEARTRRPGEDDWKTCTSRVGGKPVQVVSFRKGNEYSVQAYFRSLTRFWGGEEERGVLWIKITFWDERFQPTALGIVNSVIFHELESRDQLHNPHRADPEEASKVLNASLEWLLQTLPAHPTGPLKTACLMVFPQGQSTGTETPDDQTVRPELEGLILESSGLRPKRRADCGMTRMAADVRDNLHYDRETGEPAVFLRISLPDFKRPYLASVVVGFHLGGLSGQGWSCLVEKRESAWMVGTCRLRWES